MCQMHFSSFIFNCIILWLFFIPRKATLYIQNTQIASSFGSSRTNAQQNVSKDAYYKLKRFCFVIKVSISLLYFYVLFSFVMKYMNC